MKIWRAWVADPQEGICYVWDISLRDVKCLAHNTFDEGLDIKYEKINIPATKTGLVDWLNDNFTRDNG